MNHLRKKSPECLLEASLQKNKPQPGPLSEIFQNAAVMLYDEAYVVMAAVVTSGNVYLVKVVLCILLCMVVVGCVVECVLILTDYHFTKWVVERGCESMVLRDVSRWLGSQPPPPSVNDFKCLFYADFIQSSFQNSLQRHHGEVEINKRNNKSEKKILKSLNNLKGGSTSFGNSHNCFSNSGNQKVCNAKFTESAVAAGDGGDGGGVSGKDGAWGRNTFSGFSVGGSGMAKDERGINYGNSRLLHSSSSGKLIADLVDSTSTHRSSLTHNHKHFIPSDLFGNSPANNSATKNLTRSFEKASLQVSQVISFSTTSNTSRSCENSSATPSTPTPLSLPATTTLSTTTSIATTITSTFKNNKAFHETRV